VSSRFTWIPAVLLVLACGAEEPAAPAPPAPAATPGPAAAPTAPEPEATAGPGFPCIEGEAARGASLYTAYCASCHGTGGDGQGPAAAGLNPKPARHSDGDAMNRLSDDEVFTVIKEGGRAVGKSPLMAPWGGNFSDAEIRDLVAYVRSLAVPPYTCP
jgi:mono/diheme cytochrome c family protein